MKNNLVKEGDKQSRLRRFGKSTLVNDQFLASCERDESVEFSSLRYVAMSWNRYAELQQKSFEEGKREMVDEADALLAELDKPTNTAIITIENIRKKLQMLKKK